MPQAGRVESISKTMRSQLANGQWSVIVVVVIHFSPILDGIRVLLELNIAPWIVRVTAKLGRLDRYIAWQSTIDGIDNDMWFRVVSVNGERNSHDLSATMNALVGAADKQQVQVFHRRSSPLDHGIFEDLLHRVMTSLLLTRGEPMGSFRWRVS